MQRQKSLTAEEQKALKEACDKVFMDQVSQDHYQKVLEIGKEVQDQKTEGSVFLFSNPFQALVVAQLTAKAKWDETNDIYACVSPGGGKTSIVCWTAKVINSMHPSQHIVIATTKDVLVKQLEIFSKQFNLKKTMFCNMDQLQFMPKEAVIIFDEYYHAVFKHKLTINGGGAVQGIYGLREVGQRRLMLGGLCGDQFKDEILPKLVANPIFIDKFPSVFSILGQSIDGGTKVTTHPNMKQLTKECMEHIVKRAV